MSTSFVCPACGRSSRVRGDCPVDARPFAETSDPLLGRELGSFRLARVLGRGGMGTVYAGVHMTIGSAVAIKVIAQDYARDAELLERFFREAQSVNLIKHEGIVNILDLARLPDGRSYITMELLEGQTLRNLIQSGPLPFGGLVTAMIDVLEALAAAHAIKIIHRDLKPDNVFISSTGRTKVLDFGIAKLSSAGAMRTKTGAVLGTPEYMAPEQISGGACDERTDVYAMGVMLFEGVTGRRPFEAASDYGLMIAHVSTPPPLPSTVRGDVSPALEDVILCALAKQPSDRFGSALAMAEALRYVASTLNMDQWIPLVPRGRLMTPRPPNPPASGPFVFARRPPSPSETTPMRPQRSDRDHPKIPGPTQVIADGPIGARRHAQPAVTNVHPTVAERPPRHAGADAQPPQLERRSRNAGADARPTSAEPRRRDAVTDPTRHERPPRTAPPGRLRWPWIAGSSVVAIGAVAFAIGRTRSEHPTTAPPEPASIATTSGPLNQPADYDPACLDPLGYLPRARSIATHRAADAELVSLTFEVGPSGCADVRSGGTVSSYMFRTAAGDCIGLFPQRTGIVVMRNAGCSALKPWTPGCTVAQLVQRARSGGLAPGTTASVVGTYVGWAVSIAGHGAFIYNACDDGPVKTSGPSSTVTRQNRDPDPAAPAPIRTKPAAPSATPAAGVETLQPDAVPVAPTPADLPPSVDPAPYDVIATKERYDPKRFDPNAFYPRAVALARARMPDAKLVAIVLRGLMPDGAIVLTPERAEPTRFVFYSASKTEGHCSMVVKVFPDRVETRTDPLLTECPRLPSVRMPRCSPDQIRERIVLGAGLVWKHAGELSLTADGWNFHRQHIADDCE